MVFENLRIKTVQSITHYTPNLKRWRAKNRKNHFIGIILGGSAKNTFAQKSFVLSRNCIYFFNQKEDYDVEVYEPGESFSVHFTTYEEIETESFCIPIENPEPFLSLLQRAEHVSRSSESGDLALVAALYRLCDAVAHAKEKAYFPKDARIYAAKRYMDENYRERDCLCRAIERSGLSSRRFNDLFQKHFSATPSRYLTLRKIEQAKSLLEAQGLTVTETAELCGFSDVYYFSKVFKQICGVAPSEWK